MVLGTSSGAGKSWLVTALCRWYARQGLRVAPFKAQNMSNNARVVAGGEIGSAQYFQALAAGVEPTVQMNPLLLKPEADTRSQVVLLGQVDARLTGMPWRARCAEVWPLLAQTLDDLRRQYDVIVIEGAGSPAEINLQSSDVVNLRVARHADAVCLLVSDIDRGGAFAHLYGTWALMPEDDRRRLRGFVLNRFRGDPGLLAPAPERMLEMTGVPVVATVPMWTGHGLPEEDGWFQYRDRQTAQGSPPDDRGCQPAQGRTLCDMDRQAAQGRSPEGCDGAGNARASAGPRLDDGAGNAIMASAGPRGDDGVPGPRQVEVAGACPADRPVCVPARIALLVPPRISNLDEFEPLAALRGVQLVAVREAGMRPELSVDDWIILPGSKHTSTDLAWLKRQGLDAWVRAHAARGGRVLGICGGLQILGQALRDPLGLDGAGQGLGLLPLQTVFGREKVLRRRTERFGSLPGPWSVLSGVQVTGYEIHQGQTQPVGADIMAGATEAIVVAEAAEVADVMEATGTTETAEIAEVAEATESAEATEATEAAAGAAIGVPGVPGVMGVLGVLPDGLGWCNARGNVLGVYLHGMFENDDVLQALFGQQARPLAAVFDGLADHVGNSFAPGVLDGLLGMRFPRPGRRPPSG